MPSPTYLAPSQISVPMFIEWNPKKESKKKKKIENRKQISLHKHGLQQNWWSKMLLSKQAKERLWETKINQKNKKNIIANRRAKSERERGKRKQATRVICSKIT